MSRDLPSAAAATDPAPPPTTPPRPGHRGVRALMAVLLAGGLAVAALLLTLGTESGSRQLLALVPGLQVEALRGALAGDLDIRRLRYALGPQQTLLIEGLSWRRPVFDWNPGGEPPSLRLARLDIATIDLQGPSADTGPTTLPDALVLPLSLHVDALQIGQLTLDAIRTRPLRDLSAVLDLPAGEQAQHRLDEIRLRQDRLQLHGQLSMTAAAPMTVEARIELQPDAQASAATGTAPAPLAQDWRLDLGLRGPLARIEARARLVSHGQSLEATALLRPDQALPLSRLQARLTALDLAPFASGLPQTALTGSIEALLEPTAPPGQHGTPPLRLQIDLANQQPGRIDQGRLPLASLRLGATGDPRQPDIGTLETLRLALHDGRQPAGTVLGNGRWSRSDPKSGRRLELALSTTLQDLRPDGLDLRAPAMHLSGPLTLSWSPPPEAARLPRGTLQTDLRGRHASRDLPELRLALRLNGTPERIELEHLQVGSGPARLRAQGVAERREAGQRWQLETQASLERFDPSLWWPGTAAGAWQRGPHRLDGRLQATLGGALPLAADQDARALLAGIEGQARLELSPSVLAGVPLSGTLQLRRAGAGPRHTLQTELDAWAGAPANTPGATALSLRGALAAPGGEDQAQLTLRSTALQALQPWLRLAGQDERLAGEIDGSGSLQGRWPQVRLQGRLDARQLELPAGLGVRQLALRTDAGLRSATDTIELDAEVSGLTRPGLQLDRLTLRGRGSPARHRIDLDSAMALTADGVAPRPLQARAALEGAWSTTTGLDWQGRLRDVAVRGVVPGLAAPRAAGTEALQPLLGLSELALSVQRPPDGRLSVRTGPARLELLDARLQLERMEWQSAEPADPAPALAVKARLEPLAIAPVLQKMQPDLGWSGDLQLDGQIDLLARDGRTTLAAQLRRTSGDLSLEDAELGTGPRRLGLGEIAFQLQARDGLWQFSQRIDGSQLGRIDGSQTVRTEAARLWPDADAPLEGRLALDVAQLGHWGGWLPAGWRLNGQLAGQARLGGRFGEPTYAGTLQGNGLAARNVLEGIDWREGQLRASLEGNRARVDTFSLRAGSGALDLSGEAVLDAQPTLTLQMKADRFAVLQRIDRRASLSGRADLRIDPRTTRLQGAFQVDEGRFDFTQADAPSLGEDVDVDRGQGPRRARETASGTSQRATQVDLRIGLGERFLLVGRGLNTRLTGELRLSSPASRLAVNGTIQAADGTYAAYGQKLRIERSVISFTGLPDNPRLDIEAIRPDLEDVRVGVSVTGTAQLPRIRLISDPAMSDTDKLSWLILGRASDGLGRTDMALLQRAATALVAGESNAPSLVERLGLDQFSVRQDGEGDSRATVVTLGKQISQRWYVGYERSLTAASGTWQLIYRAARRFTLRAQSGADNALDLIWTWQWGSPSLLPPTRARTTPASAP